MDSPNESASIQQRHSLKALLAKWDPLSGSQGKVKAHPQVDEALAITEVGQEAHPRARVHLVLARAFWRQNLPPKCVVCIFVLDVFPRTKV